MIGRFLVLFLVLILLIANLNAETNNKANVDPINVLFELFTRNNPTIPQVLKLNDTTLLQQSNYNKNLPTKICAHGWVGFPDRFYDTATEYLKREDCNVISVDWSILADGDYDYVAINNVPTAGVTTGAFVDFLVQQGTPLTAFHLIGFSMGAHVVGDAGAAVTSGKLPRITGLDPASVDFPLDSLDTRLDTTDAQFVDIIHTNVAFTTAMGHADFYPNDGLVQPGCPVPDNGCCNHCRAVEYFTESINSPVGFRSLNCASYDYYQSGACNGNSFSLMGEPTITSSNGTYYLNTNAASPYARG